MLKRTLPVVAIATLVSVVAIATLLTLGVRAPPRPAEAWNVPDPDTLADDAFGHTYRRGRDFVVKMSSLVCPDAAVT